MKSYADFQEEINGLKDVSETVQTIEKIAATKVIFFKKKSADLNFYITNLRHIIFRLLSFYSIKNNFLLQEKEKGKKILLVVTSNKSLVGGLWHRATDKVLKTISEYDVIYTLGDKGKQFLEEENVKIEKSFVFTDEIPTNKEVGDIGNILFGDFKMNEIRKIDIIYPSFKSISEQEIVKTHFLPFDFIQDDVEKDTIGLPIFEQSKEFIFSAFLEKYIHGFFYSIILESSLSEFSAKTLEMEHAAKKSKEIISNKKKEFTREKRKNVTQRQLEAFNYKK